MNVFVYLGQQFSPWFLFVAGVTVPVVLFGDESCVKFDVPSTLPSCEVSSDVVDAENQRLVKLVVPVSTIVGCHSEKRVLELMVQVRGLGAGIQVVDYGPRTQLYSDIEGSIAVEQHQGNDTSLGIGANGSAADLVGLNVKANFGQTHGSTERFQKIPDQKLLLASGTIGRGTGAYFKFRHSPQSTLEGGHELILTLRVPASWRGGMLRVDCLATGKQRELWGESDFRAGHASFVVATWLQGDAQAQEIVERYSQLESRIYSWATANSRNSKKRAPEGLFREWMQGGSKAEASDDWMHRFALLDSRSIEGKLKPRLPQQMRRTADLFLVYRRNVLELAR